MRRLAKKFTKYGEQFKQVCRTDNTAIYLRHINGGQKSYEVIVVRLANRRADKCAGKARFIACEPYECYPASEKWGTSGWTYNTEKDARAKYDLLNGLPTPTVCPTRLRAPDGILQVGFLAAASVKTAGELPGSVLQIPVCIVPENARGADSREKSSSA
jgi:hypothetical protein